MKHGLVEYRLFTEAWLLLALSRTLILFRPFRSLTPILGTAIEESEAEKILTEHKTDEQILLQIQRSIVRASKRSPWRTMCFEQDLTARMMLSFRKIRAVVFFGVLKPQNHYEEMKAHAWVNCSGFIVTGGQNNSYYSILGRFKK